MIAFCTKLFLASISFIVFIHASNPYQETQILHESEKNGASLDISDQNQFLVLGNDDDNLYIFSEKINENGFQLHQTINDSRWNVEAVDITGDAEYLLAIDLDRTARIYQSNSSGMFQIFQTILLSTNTGHRSYAGAITDDHQWLLAGINNQIKVFTFNESLNEFTLNDTLQNMTGQIFQISLTNDHSFMAASTDRDYVYVFKYNGSNFQQIQPLQFNSKNGERAFLSDDHQNLIMSEDKTDWFNQPYCYVYIYKYKSQEGKFQFDLRYRFGGTQSNFASLSPDNYFMTFSGSERSYIQSQPLNYELSIQNTFVKSKYNKFSKNMKYLVTTQYSKSRVYNLDCNWNVTGGYLLNETSGVCEMCAENCAFCYNLTLCQLCQEQNSYARNISTNECVLCSGGKFIENSTCFQCVDQCTFCWSAEECLACEGGFFVDENKTCSKCQQNCLHCQSYEHCIECNESDGYARDNLTGDCIICGERYFISENLCLSCSDNCLECSSTSECLQCIQRYFISEEKSCSVCPQNCQKCSNASFCEVCDEENGYARNSSSGRCSECTERKFIDENICYTCVDNCAQCQSSECSTCDNGYFLSESGLCEACFTGCLSCKGLYECQQCVQNKGYHLSSGMCVFCGVANTFMENGKCVECQIEGCLQCSSLDTCEECSSEYMSEDKICVEVSQVEWWMIVGPILIIVSIVAIGYFCWHMRNKETKYVDEPNKNYEQKQESAKSDNFSANIE